MDLNTSTDTCVFIRYSLSPFMLKYIKITKQLRVCIGWRCFIDPSCLCIQMRDSSRLYSKRDMTQLLIWATEHGSVHKV